MKIKVKQSKLMELLDYLYVDGLFPISTITTKDGNLISAEMDENHFYFRYEQFSSENFEEISKEKESVCIDVQKVKGFVSLRGPEEIITLQFPSPYSKNKLLISSKGTNNNISVLAIDEDINMKLPFELKDKTPHINKGEVALNNHVLIKNKSLKKLKEYSAKHATDYYRFKIDKKKKFNIIVGDIYENEDYTSFEPEADIISLNEEVIVSFTKGIKELSNTCKTDINVYMKSNLPTWFTEVSDNHKFGLFVAPLSSE